jgi:hypothetical protein
MTVTIADMRERIAANGFHSSRTTFINMSEWLELATGCDRREAEIIVNGLARVLEVEARGVIHDYQNEQARYVVFLEFLPSTVMLGKIEAAVHAIRYTYRACQT